MGLVNKGLLSTPINPVTKPLEQSRKERPLQWVKGPADHISMEIS